jgi:murein DD-endopeptidase MepM/ murein hydrolase activator NlpD
MIDTPPKAPPLYPKSHLLAASGIAALLSLALLVFPSSDVEANRASMAVDLESPADQLKKQQDAPDTSSDNNEDGPASPFQQLDSENQDPASQDTGTAQATPDAPVDQAAATEPATPSAPGTTHRQVVVAKGDNLSSLFQKVGLPASAVAQVLASDKQANQFNKLHQGQMLEFELAPDGQLQSLHSKVNDLDTIRLTRADTGFAFTLESSRPVMREAYAHGVITSNLSMAAQRSGLSRKQVTDLAGIFRSELDFGHDIRHGDQFDVIYEQRVLKDKVIGTGNILSARFVARGKTYTAVRYTNKQGATNYYTADGNSMRKAFVRSPVQFLNKVRAHEGVDFAAPRGTPILATGDGKVFMAGRKGGYGNVVILQHGKTYRTLYGHMQGFAKGIHAGVPVKQGQVIGYIGTTGLSTGPHVHYEFQINGVHVDPLGQKLPMADPIAKNERARFNQQSQPLMAQMEQHKTTMLASKR